MLKVHGNLAESTQRIYDQLNAREDLSPRVKMALRMYAHGACNLSQAAEAMGLTVGYLSMCKNSPAGQAFMETAHDIINEKAANTSALLSKLSVRAVQVLGVLMEDSPSEKIRLEAAKDLADRGPETSKIQKHQVESFSITGDDAKALAAALVRGSSVHERYAHLKHDNYDMVQEIPCSVQPSSESQADNPIAKLSATTGESTQPMSPCSSPEQLALPLPLP